MLAYVLEKSGIGGGPYGGGVIGTNKLPGALTWLIIDLRLFTKYGSTTGFLPLSSF